MARTVKVARTSEIAPGSGKSIDVEGERVALFNVDGSFHAIEDGCTHVGGPLGEGTLDGAEVVCPWHGARFNVKTGKVQCPPAGADVKVYAVHVDGDDVSIEVDG